MTKAIVLGDVYQEPFKKDDRVTIDGYARGCDDRPYAVVIRETDGAMGFAPLDQLRAIGGTY